MSEAENGATKAIEEGFNQLKNMKINIVIV